MGIEWVKANIAAFGGDADSITLFDQSLGGTDISLQYLVYGGARETPFTAAIMESGTATTQWEMLRNSTAVHTTAVTIKVGCAKSEEAAGSPEALACLEALPLKSLLDVVIAYGQATAPPWDFTVFAPVVDGDFFSAGPSELYRSGRFSKNIPMMAGWNHDDASISVSTSLVTPSKLEALFAMAIPGLSSQNLTDLLSLYPNHKFDAIYEANKQVPLQYYGGSRIFRDLLFTCPALAFGAVNLEQNVTSNIRFYKLDQTVSTEAFYAPRNQTYLSTSHFSDVPYIFDELAAYGITDAAQLEVASAVSRAWSSFAARGKPGETLGEWPTAYIDG